MSRGLLHRPRADRAALAFAAVAFSLLATYACFSERGVTAPPADAICQLPLDPDVAGSTVVIIRDFTFEPATVRIKAGTRVTWLNCSSPDDPAHTTTSDASGWNSPLMSDGEKFTVTFDTPGSFPYHCEPHPFMQGTVEVEL